MNKKLISGGKKGKKGEPTAEEIEKQQAADDKAAADKADRIAKAKKSKRGRLIAKCKRELKAGTRNFYKGYAIGILGYALGTNLNPFVIQIGFLQAPLIILGILIAFFSMPDIFSGTLNHPGPKPKK